MHADSNSFCAFLRFCPPSLLSQIYHMTFSPPPPEIVSRLQQRSDDTEEKAVTRLEQHKKNEAAVIAAYKDKLVRVDGNRKKDVVGGELMAVLKAI